MPYFIFDGHLDLAMNALEWNRDLTQTVEAIRQREAGQPCGRATSGSMYGHADRALHQNQQAPPRLAFAATSLGDDTSATGPV